MVNDDESLCIVYNGEVYNFAELRKKLPEPNRYRSSSDTEVVLRAYESWGIDCLQHFNGMFDFIARGHVVLDHEQRGIDIG